MITLTYTHTHSRTVNKSGRCGQALLVLFRIKLMTETGILEYFAKRHPMVNDTCSRIKEEMNNERALTLPEIGAPFVILAAGIPTAISVLLLEVMIKNMRRKNC